MMNTRRAIRFLTLLLIPALLFSGCRRAPGGENQTTAPSGITAPTETAAPTEATVPTEPQSPTVPETAPAGISAGIQDSAAGLPYEVLTLSTAEAVLLYDGNCNYDIYHGGDSDGVFLYELTLLSRKPLEQGMVMMTAEEISAYQCTLEDMTDVLYDELEEHPYIHASALGLDAEKAVSLYHTWLQAHEQYLQTRSAEDFEARKSARDAYDDYLGTEDAPELPYHVYRLTLTAFQFWGQAEAVIRNLEFQLGQERHTLPIGEIRAHDIHMSNSSQEQDQMIIVNEAEPSTYAFSASGGIIIYTRQLTLIDRQTGLLEATVALYTLEDCSLEKLEVMGNGTAAITDIRVEHETGADGHIQPWTGDEPLLLEADTTVTVTAKIELRDLRVMSNPMYHGAVNCALHYETTGGMTTAIFGATICPEPDYLALCALHLDGLNLNTVEGWGGSV